MTRTDRLDAPLRNRRNVVIAGGGVAALEALLALRSLAGQSLAVQLVVAEPHFWYRPLAVAEPFGLGTTHRFPLEEIAHEAGAELVPAALSEVDVDEQLARLAHGPDLPFDALLLATGARPVRAIAGALTFRGPADAEAFGQLLRDVEARPVTQLVFAAPTGASWHLPLYELALLTEAWLVDRGVRGRVELSVVTPEDRPLQAFGATASDAVVELLADRAIAFHGGLHPDSFAEGILTVLPRRSIAASHVVALPRLEGTAPAGVPHDRHGFVAVDANCRVRGVSALYAAGDVTTLPVKQGGLAAQQADAAASSIAADLGLDVVREPFHPVLRGLLLTGRVPRFLRAEVGAGSSAADSDPLWWPPAKIVGKHLAPYLAARAGLSLDPPMGEAVPVDVSIHS